MMIINPKEHYKTISTGKILVDKKAVETKWRNSELERTDKLIILPDYPVDLLAYRSALRDYPAQIDFPNGSRPK